MSGTFDYFRTHSVGNPLLALPPAFGKSIVIAEFCRRALTFYPSTRILNIVHVKELIKQNFEKFIALWPTAPAGIYSAGLNRRDTDLPVLFTGIASIAKRIQDFGRIDLVIVDECDMVSHKEETQYRKVLAALKERNPAVRFIGLTATPFRIGLGSLTDGGIFNDKIIDYCSYEKFNSLIDLGFLCPLIPKKTDAELDIEGVHMGHDGDFKANELEAACNVDRVTEAALQEALRVARDRKHWLVFTTGVKHANSVNEKLNQYGISSLCVHTDLPAAHLSRENLIRRGITPVGETSRDMHINAFRNGNVQAMTGVGIFGVGFDAPFVDCIVMLRPTMSTRIWVQYLGRGLRVHPDKRNTLVLDFARNTARLGPINDPVLPRKPGQKAKGMAPFKICPECMSYCHTRVPFCPDCGYEFPVLFKGTQSASERELIRRPPPIPKLALPPALPQPPPAPPKPPKPKVEITPDSFRVDRVEFTRSQPKDPTKEPSLRISYICGLRIFSELLMFENPHGLPRHKAREKWRMLANEMPPGTVEEALRRTSEIRMPREIRVLTGGKYNEIVGYDL